MDFHLLVAVSFLGFVSLRQNSLFKTKQRKPLTVKCLVHEDSLCEFQICSGSSSAMEELVHC